MKRPGMPWDQFQKDMSAAEDRMTGRFTCSNDSHRAHGEKFIVNGRVLCRRCKDLRDKNHVAAMKTRKRLRD